MLIPNRLDYYGIGRRYIIARAKKIDPAMIDVEGSEANVFVGATSFMAQKVSQQLAEGLRSLTLDADGDDLDRVVIDRYQLPRKGASAAVAPLRFFRATATAGSGSIPVGTKTKALGGQEYITLTSAAFATGQLDNVFCDARAVQAGFAAQVGANQIRNLSNPGLLFDPSIQVTNDEPAAGGIPREQDPQYRQRARNFWLAARRGTLGAIETGATAVEGVDSAYAEEALDSDGNPARIVTLVAADAAGVCNRVLAARLRAQLRDFRAGGITVIVLNSTPQIISIQLALTFVADVDTATLTTQVLAAVVEFVNSLGANQVLRRGELMAVLTRFKDSGLIVTNGSIATPTGDLVPTFGYTLRTRLENVTTV